MRVESDPIQITRNSMSILVTQLATFGLGLVTAMFLARTLGPEGKGVVSLLILIPTAVTQLGKLGLDLANTHYAARHPEKIRSLVSNSLLVVLFWGFFLATIVLFVVQKAELPFKGLLVLAAWLSPLALAQVYLLSLFLGLKRFRWVNLLQFSSAVLYLGGILFAWLGSLTGAQAFGSWALALLISFVLGTVILWRSWPLGLDYDLSLFISTMKYGLKAQVGHVAAFINLRLDQFLIVVFLGTSGLGLYSVAVASAEVLAYLPMAVGIALFPALSARSQPGYLLAAQSLRLVLAFLGVIELGLFFLAPWFIPMIFGAQFVPAIPAFRILLLANLAHALNVILANFFLGEGKPFIPSLAALAGLPFTILANLFLVPLLGIDGAAFASLLAYASGSAINLLFFLRNSPLGLKDIFLPTREDLQLLQQSWEDTIKQPWAWRVRLLERVQTK